MEEHLDGTKKSTQVVREDLRATREDLQLIRGDLTARTPGIGQ